jgi:hypothetical protein
MSSKELTNPLQRILANAAATLPVTTGRVALEAARIDRRRGGVVILADVSQSMDSPAWGVLRKIDVLREAVDMTMRRSACTLIAFSAAAVEVQHIPEPDANTDLAAGLRAAQSHDPGVTLVISDGQPDDDAAALAVARSFRGVINVLYVGPDSDAAAIAFMRRLAAAADGDVSVNDIRGVDAARLTQSITALLPGPQR